MSLRNHISRHIRAFASDCAQGRVNSRFPGRFPGNSPAELRPNLYGVD